MSAPLVSCELGCQKALADGQGRDILSVDFHPGREPRREPRALAGGREEQIDGGRAAIQVACERGHCHVAFQQDSFYIFQGHRVLVRASSA